MATAFFSSTASLIVSASVKFRPVDTGHLFFSGIRRLPAPSKTHRWGLLRKSCGSQLMVNASNSRFLYFRSLETRRQLGLLVIRKHSNDRDKRVRKFRVIPLVLISKRNDEIAIARISALTKASRDFGFDTIYDLSVEGHIIIRKIDILPCATMGKAKSKTKVLKSISTNYQETTPIGSLG